MQVIAVTLLCTFYLMSGDEEWTVLGALLKQCGVYILSVSVQSDLLDSSDGPLQCFPYMLQCTLHYITILYSRL